MALEGEPLEFAGFVENLRSPTVLLCGSFDLAQDGADVDRLAVITTVIFTKPLQGDLEERIMFLLLRDGGDRAVAGAEQGFGGQGEELFANLLFREVPLAVAVAHGAGQDGVADDGHVGGVFLPVADGDR